MLDWTSEWLISVSRSTNTSLLKAFNLNFIVGLSGISSPNSKSHFYCVQQSSQANKDYFSGGKGKSQIALGARLKSLLTGSYFQYLPWMLFYQSGSFYVLKYPHSKNKEWLISTKLLLTEKQIRNSSEQHTADKESTLRRNEAHHHQRFDFYSISFIPSLWVSFPSSALSIFSHSYFFLE